MLFEKVLNRHKNSYINDLVFPSIIFPALMITGLCLLLLIPVLLYLGRDVFYNLPSLTFACGTSGMGLIVGSVYVGHFWGLIKEKRNGVVRKNYNALMNWYIFVLIILWAWPLYFSAAFFSQYPIQGYRSYIIDMKPTPEVKAEIEKLGLYEIKWHTPYDYSLDRQTIRYDFFKRKNEWAYFTKIRALTYCANSKYGDKKITETPPNEELDKLLNNFTLTSDLYPSPIKYKDNYTCSIKLQIKNPPIGPLKTNYVGDDFAFLELLRDGENIYYDASPAFRFYKNINKQRRCVKKSRERNEAFFKFWVSTLYLPNICKNSLNIKESWHNHIDFGKRHFMSSLRNL